MKKNYEEFIKIIDRESKKDIPLPRNQAQSSSILRDLFKNSMESEMNNISYAKCIESI